MKRTSIAPVSAIVFGFALQVAAFAEPAPSIDVGVYPQEMHQDVALKSEAKDFHAVALLPDGELLVSLTWEHRLEKVPLGN